jgi:hypothetical protein
MSLLLGTCKISTCERSGSERHIRTEFHVSQANNNNNNNNTYFMLVYRNSGFDLCVWTVFFWPPNLAGKFCLNLFLYLIFQYITIGPTLLYFIATKVQSISFLTNTLHNTTRLTHIKTPTCFGIQVPSSGSYYNKAYEHTCGVLLSTQHCLVIHTSHRISGWDRIDHLK